MLSICGGECAVAPPPSRHAHTHAGCWPGVPVEHLLPPVAHHPTRRTCHKPSQLADHVPNHHRQNGTRSIVVHYVVSVPPEAFHLQSWPLSAAWKLCRFRRPPPPPPPPPPQPPPPPPPRQLSSCIWLHQPTPSEVVISPVDQPAPANTCVGQCDEAIMAFVLTVLIPLSTPHTSNNQAQLLQAGAPHTSCGRRLRHHDCIGSHRTRTNCCVPGCQGQMSYRNEEWFKVTARPVL